MKTKKITITDEQRKTLRQIVLDLVDTKLKEWDLQLKFENTIEKFGEIDSFEAIGDVCVGVDVDAAAALKEQEVDEIIEDILSRSGYKAA